MSLLIRFVAASGTARLSWRGSSEDEAFRQLASVIQSIYPSYSLEDANTLVLPWIYFLQARRQLRAIQIAYQFKIDIEDSDTRYQIQSAQELGSGPEPLGNATEKQLEDVDSRLVQIGFGRDLKPFDFQRRNVARLSSVRRAATFSVPGAGKTTEALAWYALLRGDENRLIVVAPKNAFGSWDETLSECLRTDPSFIRLRGGADGIRRELSKNPKNMLITYQMLAREPETILE